MAATQRLCDLTDLAAVDRWQNMMIKDLPKPPSDYPESYKWIGGDPSNGLVFNKAGKNSGVAQILKEAEKRKLAIKRKAKEDGGDPRKSAKLQGGGSSLEAASSVAYAAQLKDDSDAEMEGEEGGAAVRKGGGGVQGMFFDNVQVGQNGGKRHWRSVCTVPLGNATFGGSKEVMKHVGDTPGQGYPTWTRTTAPAHGFQYKP